MISKNRAMPTMEGPTVDGSPASVPCMSARICIPHGARGLVLLVRAGDNATEDPVEHALEMSLKAERFATCSIDLIDDQEHASDAELDSAQLSDRLESTLAWIGLHRETAHLPLTVLATRDAAAAAVIVAARAPELLSALICHRGELQGLEEAIQRLTLPTLLVTPSGEKRLVAVNHEAFMKMDCTSQLAVIRGATRDYREAGTLAACQHVVCQWTKQYACRHRALAASRAIRVGEPLQSLAG